jgi:queuosine precursor transporter
LPHEPSPHPLPHRAPAPRRATPIVVLAIAAAAGPYLAVLLHALAQYGSSPPATLPWPVLVLVGVLLAAPLSAAAARLPVGVGALVATVAAAAGAIGAVALGLPVRDLATLPVALAVAGALRALPGRRAELYGAALVFVGATVLANFTLDSFLPFGDFFLVNVGTLFFGITFTQRDRLHRFGRGVVYRVIAVAAVANVLAAWSVGTPWRYVAVSFLVILVAEAADTEVYHRLLHLRWFARVAGSNAVSAPLDTVLFTVLAFAGAPFATPSWMTQVIVTDVVVKYAASLVAAITVLSNPAWVPKAPDRSV